MEQRRPGDGDEDGDGDGETREENHKTRRPEDQRTKVSKED